MNAVVGRRSQQLLILNFFAAKISRMVPHLLLNDSIYVVTFCYGVMSQAIRSERDKLIIEQCGYIILNLARYELTKANVFQVSNSSTPSGVFPLLPPKMSPILPLKFLISRSLTLSLFFC